jgi:hypothetical protein
MMGYAYSVRVGKEFGLVLCIVIDSSRFLAFGSPPESNNVDEMLVTLKIPYTT